MATPKSKTYFFYSFLFHVILLMILVLTFDYSMPKPVIENTNHNDIISAVVLGDSAKSKILPEENPAPQPPQKIEPEPIKKPDPVPAPPPLPPPPKVVPKQTSQAEPIQKDLITLEVKEKKILAEKKAQEKKQRELLTRDLLADIKKQDDKQKKLKQKQVQSRFEKTLQQQAEKSLRQQLLNEEIKLKGSISRQSQGVIDKYKALILQAISEHWIIPAQARKDIYCELMIRLMPSGAVIDVQVTKSSGDPSLDSSARAAVLKASPLPVPSDAEAFDGFRQFALKVKPENVLGPSLN